MTVNEVASYIHDLGFTTEVKGEAVSVVLGKSGLIRFRFPAKDFGPHGEGLAQAAKTFADELNPSMIYAIKVQELTGYTPSEVTNLPPEEFQALDEKGLIAEARAQADGAVAQAKRLAKETAERSEALKREG